MTGERKSPIAAMEEAYRFAAFLDFITCVDRARKSLLEDPCKAREAICDAEEEFEAMRRFLSADDAETVHGHLVAAERHLETSVARSATELDVLRCYVRDRYGGAF